MIDRLDEMWRLQAEHQKALGLEPSEMPEATRRAACTEIVLQAHEEVTELGRVVPTYKRHVLDMPAVNPMDAAEEAADVMKCVITWAQLHGLTAEDVMVAFRRKTAVMRHRAESLSVEMARGMKLLCVDLDDVQCDISEWRAGVALARRGCSTGAEVQAAEEAFKDRWIAEGRFMDCPPIKGAPEALRRIKRAGFTIATVTARPQWQHKRLHADTVQWQAKHGIPCDLLLFNKDKCEALYNHIQPAWPVAFVEDHTRNAIALSGIGVRVLLFDQPHNRSMFSSPLVTRVFDWTDVLDQLGVG